MSRRINKLNQNNSYKRATIPTYSSTPKNGLVMLHHCSISLSDINTASSSSGGRRNLLLQMQDLKKKYKKLKRKREDMKRRMKDSDSEWEAKQKQLSDENEKRKKKLKSGNKPAKKKRILKDTDSEWETESEKSINELSRNSRESNDEYIKLFEDPCTPEKTLDMPTTYEKFLYTHESPIGPFRKKSRLITSQNNIIPQDKLVPVNLQLAEVRNLEEIDEEEIIFEYPTNAKTYVPLRKPERNSKQKPENYNLQFPTNNLLWNQSAKTYSQKRFQTLTQKSIKVIDFMQKVDNVLKRKESSSIPPGMTCVSGYWNKTLQKWLTYTESSSSQNKLENGKRKAKTSKKTMESQSKKIMKSRRKQKNDIYSAITDETDSEFETGGQNGKRMSFREFCRKRKEVMSSDTSNKFIRL